ncbi:MAG: alanine dehydrogenase [Candidatus Omnitrophota bacterium]
MAKRRTLILDGRTIKKLITMKEAIRTAEKGFKFYGQGKVQMPPKVYIHLDKYCGDFRAMPAHVDGFKMSGIKWVNVHLENKKKGLPTVMAIMILSNPATGFPLCVMNATYATALRTGAAGGIAAKYLARRGSKKVALVGCGVQARAQLAALNEVLNVKEISVWGCRAAEIRKFIRGIEKKKKCKVKFARTIEECVRGSDVIVTTTPSRKPLVKLEWVKEGAHINAIGADARGKQELDPRILKKGKVVVDAWEQASHSGEINVPLKKKQLSKKDVCANIGEIVAGKKKGRRKKEDITIFDSTGLAVQDIAIADLVYRKARRLNKGKFIEF